MLDYMNTFFIALALAMDAFSVSISAGSALSVRSYKDTFLIAFYFGFFQFIMPLIGWFLGSFISDLTINYSIYIASILLLFLGIKMINDARSKETNSEFSLHHKWLLLLALATSIDALIVGFSYAVLERPILVASGVIGSVTFLFSVFGIFLGEMLRKIIGKKAEFFGGVVLIILSVKIIYDSFN